MLKCGIVGLPNVGKSTLFNALLKRQIAESANYPFTTIDPNVGVVEVPDLRLQKLAETIKNSSTTVEVDPPIIPAAVQFVDIAGLVKDAHKGEGLGNKFLSHIREVDAIAHVVRAFEDSDVVRSGANPKDDIETINTELILADLETIKKLIESATKAKKGTKEIKGEVEILKKIEEGLEKGDLAKNISLTKEEKEAAGVLPLITAKPVIFVFNVSESEIGGELGVLSDELKEFQPNVVISAKIEAELAQLSEDEQKDYLRQLGLAESGLERLIAQSYKLLGLITFFTAGEKEVRAWTLRSGDTALRAAAVIHTDFAKGFIKAEVISCELLIKSGGWQKAREEGLIRLEGKDYVFTDGDIAIFKFNI